MTDTETRVVEWNGENSWEQLDLPLPNQAQLLAEDAEYQRIAHEGVYDPFPHTRRKCLCCWKKATKGKVLCQGCHTKFGQVIYAD